MAEKRRVFQIVGPPTKRVRFGRATLTIAQRGVIAIGTLGDAVRNYEGGKLTADELCECFVRMRIKEHSPSFSWERADQSRILKLVVDLSEEPLFESAEPKIVADCLVSAAAKEREVLTSGTKRLRRSFGAAYPQVGDIAGIGKISSFQDSLKRLDVAGNLGKTMGLGRSILNSPAFSDQVRPQFEAMRGIQQIAGFDEDELNRISGLAGFKAINPKIFETAGWLRKLPDPAPWLRGLQEKFGPMLEGLKLALPANWRELKSDEVKQVVELMKADGLNLAWAPRPEILRHLIAAESHEARCGVLVDHREEILEDVEQVLEMVERSDLAPIVAAGFEAIKTYRAGHPAPAQTYAAAVIGEVIHGTLGYETFGEVKRQFRDKDPLHDVGYRDFPLFAVGRALARTLDRFKDAGDGFNRNLTQHRIGPPHTEPNLLTVLLLLAGLLLEVERVLNRHDAREQSEAA